MTKDPCEQIVAEALTQKGITFVTERERKEQQLDFYLPDFDLFIEVKQFSTPRTAAQIAGMENVLVIQGRAAANAFAKLLELKRDDE